MQRLTAIYQALLMVKTCGQDTIIMADCLQAFAKVLDEMANEPVEKGDE